MNDESKGNYNGNYGTVSDNRYIHGRMHIPESGECIFTNPCTATSSHHNAGSRIGRPAGNSCGRGISGTPDQGLVSDDAGNAVAQADAFNAMQETNSTPDSEDFGDIMP